MEGALSGSMVALVTPMTGGNAVRAEIDWARLDALVDFHVDQGTDAIVAVGTTGESATLDHDEHCRVIAAVVERAAGRIPVIAGTGANSTIEAIALTKCAHEAGADACLLVTPYYNKPTQRGLIAHHRAVAEAVDIPQILYNVPGRTACDMLPVTAVTLAKVPNIIGIKEATSDIERVATIRAGAGPDFLLLSGEDATTLEFLEAGGDGVISVTANVAPRQMAAMCRAAREGDFETAARIDGELAPLHRELFAEANPIPVKWALKEMGLIGDGIRLPLTELAPEYHARVRDALVAAGVHST